MEIPPIQAKVLGECSLRRGTLTVTDRDNRSRKVWLMLTYLICTRGRPGSAEELVDLLWSEDNPRSSNPLNALKTISHRVRALLDYLGDGTGRQCILHQNGSYIWNPEIPVTTDVEQFEALYSQGNAADSPEEKLRLWLMALDLYQGDFLTRMSTELWVIPIASHYHELFLQVAQESLLLLEGMERWQEAAELCRKVIRQEPYREDLYRRLMSILLAQGDQQEAVAVYENMSELFLAEFGVMPEEDTLALYRQAIRSLDQHTLPSGTILEQLRESSCEGGALVCDYDIFRAIYHSVARSVARSGNAVHLGLFSISATAGGELARRSLDRVVQNLQELLRTGLRRGDVIARCSVSQFIVLLPQANFEDSQMVCSRLVKTFARQYPHSPAQLHASVHPLEPML